jgi:hypothetical protein
MRELQHVQEKQWEKELPLASVSQSFFDAEPPPPFLALKNNHGSSNPRSRKQIVCLDDSYAKLYIYFSEQIRDR